MRWLREGNQLERVVGIDDHRWGQAVTAVVELAPDSTADEVALRDALKIEHIAVYNRRATGEKYLIRP